jgi:uncharacterized membrane protein YdjX (TVP38/TMEM64 family)
MQQPAGRKAFALVAFPLLIVALAVPVIVWHDALWSIFASGARLRDWVAGWGAWAPLVFVALQTVQVIVFVIPGEVTQIAAGYLFGAWLGTVLSVTGILVGSTVAFFLARLLGKPFVGALFPGEQLARAEKLLSSRSARMVFFLLFLIPGIPKDILCYVAGLSPLRFPFFIGASTLGRLPGIIGSSVIGTAAASGKWILLAIVSAAALLLFTAGFLLRPRIEAWIGRFAERRKPPAGS